MAVGQNSGLRLTRREGPGEGPTGPGLGRRGGKQPRLHPSGTVQGQQTFLSVPSAPGARPSCEGDRWWGNSSMTVLITSPASERKRFRREGSSPTGLTARTSMSVFIQAIWDAAMTVSVSTGRDPKCACPSPAFLLLAASPHSAPDFCIRLLPFGRRIQLKAYANVPKRSLISPL